MSYNEILLEKYNNFITKYGTTLNTEKPSVVYLRTKCKVYPIVKQKLYNEEVINVKDDFTKFIQKMVIKNQETITSTYLFNIDLSETSIRWGKPSYLKYDLYLKPKNSKALLEQKDFFQNLSKQLDDELEKLLNLNRLHTKL